MILNDHSDYYLSERRIVVLNPTEPFFSTTGISGQEQATLKS